jgi:hypothetical protein
VSVPISYDPKQKIKRGNDADELAQISIYLEKKQQHKINASIAEVIYLTERRELLCREPKI